MYGEWMSDFNLTVTEEDIKEYEERNKLKTSYKDYITKEVERNDKDKEVQNK